MNIYRWKGHWKYKVYTPKDNTVTLATVLSKNAKKIKLVETIESKQKNFGDFYKVIIDENSYVIISQTVVNNLGDILSKYGIFYPIFELENNETFYYYHVTNVLDAINQEESTVKYINDIEFTIEKLILDEKKFDGSLIFSIKNDSNLTIFMSEELIELVSKYELKGFFSDFHCSVKDTKQKEVISTYKGRVGKFFIRGDDGAYGDWIYRIFSLTDFSKKSLENALDELIECTNNMQEFLSYKKTSKSKKSYEASMYLIRFKYQNTLIEEKIFFEKCAKFSTLHKKILVYVNNVTNMKMYEDNTWQNEMHHRGIYAIVPLLFKDKKYAEDFGKLLYRWDMSSEVFQSSIIRYAFFKHGIEDEMLQLLMWRILSDGQNIQSDLNTIFMDKKLKEVFEFDVFLNQLNNISQSDLLDSMQYYGISNLILGYASNIEECKELIQKAKSYLGDKFNDKECIDTCNAPYNEHLFKEIDTLDFTSNFEKEWDTSPIGSLVVGVYLEDIGRTKKAY